MTSTATTTGAGAENTSLVNGKTLPNLEQYAQKIKKIGVGKIVTGSVSTVVLIVAAALKSGDVYGVNKILYMIIAGSIWFIITGSYAIYASRNPTAKKAYVVFYLGIIGLIYELIVLGFLIAFFVNHRGILKDSKEKHMAVVVGAAALTTLIGAIKLIHGAVLAYYGIKTNVASSAVAAVGLPTSL